jgi:hypothetical protein
MCVKHTAMKRPRSPHLQLRQLGAARAPAARAVRPERQVGVQLGDAIHVGVECQFSGTGCRLSHVRVKRLRPQRRQPVDDNMVSAAQQRRTAAERRPSGAHLLCPRVMLRRSHHPLDAAPKPGFIARNQGLPHAHLTLQQQLPNQRQSYRHRSFQRARHRGDGQLVPPP